ncbi:MAG: nucleotidyltransferase domain-containing protein [Blastocatellia bacterium]
MIKARKYRIVFVIPPDHTAARPRCANLAQPVSFARLVADSERLMKKRDAVRTSKKRTARTPRAAASAREMPPEAIEFLRKYREWEESFESPEKRMAYISALCRRIADEFKPEKIILFGSHAYGTPTPDSDLDLLVVMPVQGQPVEQAIKIGRKMKFALPLDLLVRTPRQISERLAMNDYFIREIVERGKVMYDSEHA